MTVSDLLDLAADLHGVRKSFSGKTALVVPRERLNHAEFFAACAEERGFEVSAFTSLGDAMNWLIDAEAGTRAPTRVLVGGVGAAHRGTSTGPGEAALG